MKQLLLFICAAMMIFSCGKEESGNKTVIDPVEKVTWPTVVKAYPFLEGFPVFDGIGPVGRYYVARTDRFRQEGKASEGRDCQCQGMAQQGRGQSY